MSGRFIVMRVHDDGATYTPIDNATKGHPSRSHADRIADEAAGATPAGTFAVFERVSVKKVEPTVVTREDGR